MDDSTFKLGFRVSLFDIVVLCGGIIGSAVLGREIWWAGFVVGFVILHFFLFCNVFRISRASELIWASAFVTLAGANILTEIPGWIATITASIALSSFLIWREIKRDDYHGVCWQKFNPRLAERWEVEHRESTNNDAEDAQLRVVHNLKFETEEIIDQAITVENSETQKLEAYLVLFFQPVRFSNCSLAKLRFRCGFLLRSRIREL